MLTSSVYLDIISFFVTRKYKKKQKIEKKQFPSKKKIFITSERLEEF